MATQPTPSETTSDTTNPPFVSSQERLPLQTLTNLTNPFRLEIGDNPAITLVTDLLTVDNYATWSRAMRRALRAKNKLQFIEGTVHKPSDSNDPLFEIWGRCNDMVVSWIQNSVSPSIKSSVVFVDDACEIWNELRDRFTQQNGPRIFQLKKLLASLLQEQDSVSTYYERTTPPNAVSYSTFEHSGISCHKIAGHSVQQCYKIGNANPPVCSYCNKTGHVMDKCYQLHGFPSNHEFNGKTGSITSTANMSSFKGKVEQEGDTDDSVLLTKAQFRQLMDLIQPKDAAAKKMQPTFEPIIEQPKAANMTGNIFTVAPFHKHNQRVWILDTGVTDHMICDPSLYVHQRIQISGSVKLSNGSKAPVSHIGNIRITDKLTLQNVLCVPSFTFNLISIKRLTDTLNCRMIFLANVCLIQDLATWTTIGMGEERDGLYYLMNKKVDPNSLQSLLSKFCKEPSVNLASLHSNLWHSRLSHTSYSRMKLISDPLAKGTVDSINNNHCSICHMAKQHHLPFSPSTHKSHILFDVVHYDLWGPCSEESYDGYKYFLTIVDDASEALGFIC
ncbi:hypothetical protein Nepgr_017866 [Nepenthes gracilis]|uniref:Retrotransposon Copia-like N-terminal domain-containing protein n=1 Tax=Nepenthes gracilis TaxID=150966 RepID=A0AAD3SQ70_NEPGR|nr:hypothetical protein Nepgr_017866 [Nepenthes gracilis]